jgi:hypothetical protein
LSGIAEGLVNTLKSSVGDLGSLHKKLERKSEIEIVNLTLFQNYRNDVKSRFDDVQNHIQILFENTVGLVGTGSNASNLFLNKCQIVTVFNNRLWIRSRKIQLVQFNLLRAITIN